MNSQSKWKEMNSKCKESGCGTFAKFDNTMHESEKKFCKKSAGSITKQASRHAQPSVLTNNSATDNCRNSSRQYHKSSHSSSTSQKTMMSSRMQNSCDIEYSYPRSSSIFTSSDGVIHISLRHGVQIDVTVDNSFRLTSCAGQIIIALSNAGDASAIKHPNGMVQQIDNLVEIVTTDPSQSIRYATMSGNGITFANDAMLPLEAFALDAIGTRRCDQRFTTLTADATNSVFFGKSKHGPDYNDKALNLIRKASVKKSTDDGMDVITINDFRIWQMKDGLVTVARMSFPFKIRASPMNCSFTLSTSRIHCTASSQKSSHLFVRCQDQSMHYDGKNFVVRYNGNSAGFDKNDSLFVY